MLEQRRALKAIIGEELTIEKIVKALLTSEEKSKAVTSFCEEVIACKEAAERDRERRIPGRRRNRRSRPPADRGRRNAQQ